MADAVSDLRRYLEADEKILWSGTPVRGLLFRAEDKFALPFGLFWLAITLVFATGILLTPAPNGAIVFALVPLILVAVGLYIVVGRFLWDADVRGRTSYALTDRRAVILRRFPVKHFSSMSLTRATEIQTVERRNGSGTIYFGPRPNVWNRFPRPSPDVFMFEGIRTFRVVIPLVRAVALGKA